MKCSVCVIGLGYVGLPLARLFSTKYPTIGYDIDSLRTTELMQGIDSKQEISSDLLQESIRKYRFKCTSSLNELREFLSTSKSPKDGCSERIFYIVTVPTPIDEKNNPELTPLLLASETVGQLIVSGDVVIYESTVYPGVTEEICVPAIERVSGLSYNLDFFVGYSPERMNPGDKQHTIETIKKVTSGSTPEARLWVDALYSSVLQNGTCSVSSIRVAEASKIVENCQRDVQIAFFNELSRIFYAMDIDTYEVIEAAATKWNFVKQTPGLVGGHCISVDPYYLIKKSQVEGYSPNILIHARRLNDSMGEEVVRRVVKLMNKKGVMVKDSRILLLGIAFKENCSDIRNSKVVDIYRSLQEYTSYVTVYDPLVDPQSVYKEYGVDIIQNLLPSMSHIYDAIILCVAHDSFLSLDIRFFLKENSVLFDVKGVLPRESIDGRL